MMDLERYLEGHGERLRKEGERLATLTPRERMVFELWLTGIKQKEIGFQLGLSPKTVNTYKIFTHGKLVCDSDIELVLFAVRHGLVDAYRPQALEPVDILSHGKLPAAVCESGLKTTHSR